MKFLISFGTRPEFLKLYPVVRELESHDHSVVLANTGQHREMLQPLLSVFETTPDYDLQVFERSDTLPEILATSVVSLSEVVTHEDPDWVIVQGDTSATLAGALAGFYGHRAVAHVEAGLRTYRKYAPFPEEVNRRMVASVADVHFAPTAKAAANLAREGIRDSVHVVGNTSIDMLRYTVRPDFTHPLLDWASGRRYVLVTIHRRENLGDLHAIFLAINQLAVEFPDVAFVCPLHLNPAVQDTARAVATAPNIAITKPLDTLAFHNLMARSYFIITDSGGIQEEAPSLGKPVLVARDVTERPEGVDAGTLMLVGTDQESVVDAGATLLVDEGRYRSMSEKVNPFGDGHAAARIVETLQSGLDQVVLTANW